MAPDEHIIGLGKPLGNLHSSARCDMSKHSGKGGMGSHRHAVSGVAGRSPRPCKKQCRNTRFVDQLFVSRRPKLRDFSSRPLTPAQPPPPPPLTCALAPS